MSDVLSGSAVTVQLLVLDRIEDARNIARFYVLTVEPTLFGDTALVREWGRIGVSYRRHLDLYPYDAAAKLRSTSGRAANPNAATFYGSPAERTSPRLPPAD